jgi:transposase-like protein
MKCPECGSEMTQGAPHVEGDVIQWECHRCGKIIVVPARGEED